MKSKYLSWFLVNRYKKAFFSLITIPNARDYAYLFQVRDQSVLEAAIFWSNQWLVCDNAQSSLGSTGLIQNKKAN